jgi:hypothetical protein
MLIPKFLRPAIVFYILISLCGLTQLTGRTVHDSLSALQARGPYTLHDLILGLMVHMVLVGLPISFSVRRFAR